MPSLLLLAVLPITSAAYTFPPRTLAGATISLTVEVADRPAGPGLGRVLITLTVQGAADLEVEPIRLEEPVPTWKVGTASSVWLPSEEGLTVSQVRELVQTRAGVAPLPTVRLRLRRGTEAWQETTWRDLLRLPRDPPALEQLPTLPPANWPRVLRWAAGVTAGCLLLALAGVFLRRRRPPAPPPTPVERALADLAQLATAEGRPHHDRLSAIVRAYLAAQFGLPAERLLSADLAKRLAADTPLSAEVRSDLEQMFAACDLVKYAGRTPTPGECHDLAESATALVRAMQAQARQATEAGQSTEEG